jgi:hypothetical protein
MQWALDAALRTSGASWTEYVLPDHDWFHVAVTNASLFQLAQLSTPPTGAEGFIVSAQYPIVLNTAGFDSLYYKDANTVGSGNITITALTGPDLGLSPLPPMRITKSFNDSDGIAVDTTQATLPGFSAADLINSPSVYIAAVPPAGVRRLSFLIDNLIAAPSSYMRLSGGGAVVLDRAGTTHWHIEAAAPNYDFSFALCTPWRGSRG